MYSVIQPFEVLDDDDNMVSTWLVLATDLGSLTTGDEYITDNVEEDLVEFTWVVKTSDILKFHREKLQHIVLGFDDFDVEPNLPPISPYHRPINS